MNKRARQFRYQRPIDDSVFVRVMVNVLGPCDRSISTLVQLASELHASIPFEHRVDAQPRVSITQHAPGLIDNVVIVDMVIEHRLTSIEATAQLRAAGYLEEESIA